MRTGAGTWNHNIHYHPLILDAVPENAERALDVGCGQGALARRLRAVVPHVAAIDQDRTSIDVARQRDGSAQVDYLLGDFLTFPFEPGSFDFVGSVAALHHMDAERALRRMQDLLRPAGTLAIIGLARADLPNDLPVLLAGWLWGRAYRLVKGGRHRNPARPSAASDTYESPTLWPPPHTYTEVRDLAARVLPGVRYRRHLLWRYTLIWTKPSP